MRLIRFRYGGHDYLIPKSRMNDPRIRNLISRSSVYDIDKFARKSTKNKIFLTKSKTTRRKPEIFRRKIKRRTRIINRRKLSGIEIQQLKNVPKKMGYYDFDIHAHIDRTLSYHENKRLIEGMVGKKLYFNLDESKRKVLSGWNIKEKERKLESRYIKERKFLDLW